jgi:hypothetical protein
MLLTAFTLMLGGMLAVANPAAAAPAQPYSYEECFEEVDEKTGYRLTECYVDKGVMQFIETPSGNIKVSDHGSYSTEFYVEGELVYSASGNFHYTTLIRNGEAQVDLTLMRFESTYNGSTCTGSLHFVYTNGEYRRLVVDTQCT